MLWNEHGPCRTDHPVCAFASLGAATPPLRGGEWRSYIRSLLKVDLRPQFHQPSAHDLEYVPPRVILHLVSRLLVQDGVAVENVVHVEVRLHLSPLAELEDPAETQIELFDPLPVECVQ